MLYKYKTIAISMTLALGTFLLSCLSEQEPPNIKAVSCSAAESRYTLDYLINTYRDRGDCLSIGQVVQDAELEDLPGHLILMRIVRMIPLSRNRACSSDGVGVDENVLFLEGFREGTPKQWPTGTQVLFMATKSFAKESFMDCSSFGLSDNCTFRQFLQPFALINKSEKIHIGGKQFDSWIVDSVDLTLQHFINAVTNIGNRPAAINQLNSDLDCQEPLTAYYGSTCAKITRLAAPNYDLSTYRREQAQRQSSERGMRTESGIGQREINGVMHCFDRETLLERPCSD